MYYKSCPECGANLDPGERCDCIKEQEEKRRKMEEQLILNKDKQYELKLSEG